MFVAGTSVLLIKDVPDVVLAIKHFFHVYCMYKCSVIERCP